MSLSQQESSVMDGRHASYRKRPAFEDMTKTGSAGHARASLPAWRREPGAVTKVKTPVDLGRENITFGGTGGVSRENRSFGFRPAFRDADTGAVYASCFANGQPAPFHLLDGLPDAIVVTRHPTGRVAAVKQSITSGFICDGRFYTREQAAEQVMSMA